LGAAAVSLWLSVSSGDQTRREAAAEAEIDAIRASLHARAAAVAEQARALLADPEITQFASEGGAVPDPIADASPALATADFAVLASPEGNITWREGSEVAAHTLHEAAPDGGVVDLDGGLVLMGSAQGEGAESPLLVLGILLDQQMLSTMTPDDSRQL